MPGIWVDDDFTKRTIDLVRKTLDDIGEIVHCDFRIGHVGHDPSTPQELRIPSLILIFDTSAYPEIEALEMSPALLIKLANLSDGSYRGNEAIKRAVRTNVEKYLKAIGRPIQSVAIEPGVA
jgi:hypothetical protein